MMINGSQVQSCFANGMRKAALLYNPDSGGSRKRRRELESALEILRGGGVEANLFATDVKVIGIPVMRADQAFGACGQ